MITGISLVGAGALLAGCKRAEKSSVSEAGDLVRKDEPREERLSEAEVTAIEDLMREHGILRRALLVYHESAVKLRENPASVPPHALEKTAQLFRAFGEDYHEKKLEEAFIFPTIKKAQGPAAVYADVLLAQHVRGREITDYVLAITAADKIAAGDVAALISVLESFVRMYEHHAAVEDTIIFPAWKAALHEGEIDEMGARFEEIEQQQFGEDGFAAALKRMAEIEESLGLANLGMFTAPAPPARTTSTR